MVLSTTDTFPGKYTVLGVVQVGFVAVPVHKTLGRRHTEQIAEGSVEWAKATLEVEAEELGADAVIGLRIASLFGNNCLLMGTAIKLGA